MKTALKFEISENTIFAARKFGIGAILFAVTFLCVWVTFRSMYSPPPIQQINGSVTIEYRRNTLILSEERSFIGIKDETVYFNRKLYKKHDPSQFFYVEGGLFHAEPGRFSVVRAHAVPSHMMGEWCSEVEISWWPAWSQREFNAHTEDVCFQIREWGERQ